MERFLQTNTLSGKSHGRMLKEDFMKIKKIHLKDYKRFHDLTIDLGQTPQKIIALVGPNGCGKSSVFDAFLFLNNSYNQIGNTGYKDYTYHSLEQKPNYNYQNITIEFDEGNFDDVRNKLQINGKENTIFTFRSPYRYNSNLKLTQSIAVSELRLNSYGASCASSIDDRMEENYRRLQIKYNKYLYEYDARPSEAKTHIISELNSSIQNCLNLQIDNLGNIEDSKGTLYFTKKDSTIPFEFNVLSAGEKEVIDLLLDLYLRKDEYTDSIYIIDEPELHLNTSIQRSLMKEIDKLVPDNCQIWIATHSIGFLRSLQEEFRTKSQIIEFSSENNWAKEKYILEPIIPSRNKWKDIFSTALDDLTNLISPKTIVYCEGRYEPTSNHEERGLDAIVYNTIFNESYPDVLFVSSGGNTEPEQRSEIALTIISKIYKDIEILVLKDRDMASGKNTTANDRLIYLQNNPKNHRILKRWEIENYLYDKEVLNAYCQDNGLVFDSSYYDSIVTDIENQNLKDMTGRIKKSCNIISNINAEVFKKNLAKYVTPNTKAYKDLYSSIFEK